MPRYATYYSTFELPSIEREKTTDIFQWPMQILLFFLFDGGELKLYGRFLYSYACGNHVLFSVCDYSVEMYVSSILHLPEEFKNQLNDTIQKIFLLIILKKEYSCQQLLPEETYFIRYLRIMHLIFIPASPNQNTMLFSIHSPLFKLTPQFYTIHNKYRQDNHTFACCVYLLSTCDALCG